MDVLAPWRGSLRVPRVTLAHAARRVDHRPGSSGHRILHMPTPRLAGPAHEWLPPRRALINVSLYPLASTTAATSAARACAGSDSATSRAISARTATASSVNCLSRAPSSCSRASSQADGSVAFDAMRHLLKGSPMGSTSTRSLPSAYMHAHCADSSCWRVRGAPLLVPAARGRWCTWTPPGHCPMHADLRGPA